jgi:hypothetical protein
MVERMNAGRSRAAALGSALQRRPWPIYLVLALPAFAILEMLVAGERAVQYAHVVFDDDVPRLFSIASDPSHALSRRRWLAASVLVALAASALVWQGAVAFRHVLPRTSRALVQIGWDLSRFATTSCSGC